MLISGTSNVRLLEISSEKKNPFAMSDYMKKNEKKVILITGGSRGIGAATAKLLASKGHSVVINYVKSDREAVDLVEEITSCKGRIFAIKNDISNLGDTVRLFETIEEEFGVVDGVVHCAAPHPIPASFDDTEWDVFQNHFDVHIKGAFNCAKLALPKMVKSGSGALVFLSSIFAEGTPPSQQTAYITAKAALSAMARSLAVEYGPKGVRINIVSPGMTHTAMMSSVPEKVKILAKMNTPLRRLGDVDDVAHVIEFLLSHSARHITGENIRVCGGISM
jgi:3-oxoacyl-[acyl-carrier protein] reductase